MNLRLTLLGAPEASCDGRRFALHCERRTQLLVLLALRRSWTGRSELAALLWPELEAKLAYTNLRKAVFRAQAIPWAASLESDRGALRFDVQTDVADFEAALRERRTPDALALYQDELLAGFDDGRSAAWTSWLGFERDRLRAAWRQAAHEYLAGDADPKTAAQLVARLMEADPLDEGTVRVAMSSQARQGHVGRALQTYRDYAARLAAELGLTPGVELLGLHNALRSTAGGAPPRAGGDGPTPVAATIDDGFVGRAMELRRIDGLLSQADCRLLCLIGPGGVGKTRLAQRLLTNPQPVFTDGAIFVPLEDIDSPPALAARLASALQITLKGRDVAFDQIVAHLREREMLLVLDNFEHLVAHAALLDRLLQHCARVKILVTSRVRLASASEWLMPLEGLPCPDDEDLDRLEAFDAPHLFVRAARRVQPQIDARAESAAIAAICRQVGGLPLALELAASWTRVLSCATIAAELQRGVQLLRETDATRPPRHASIDVVFEHSWRLLTVGERDALARLSVFNGSFSAEAAQAVTGARLPVLGALADKSLLGKEGQRLLLHPLVQQLAASKLNDATLEATQAAHAGYFHQLMNRLAEPADVGERGAMQTMEQEFDNLRRTWHWTIAQGPADALGQSVRALLAYCDFRGRVEEGLSLLRAAVESPRLQANRRLRALMLSKMSHLEYRLDRYADAEASAAQALAAAARGDAATRTQALNVLGVCAFRLGRMSDARRCFQQALKLTPPESQAHRIAVTLDHLALIEKSMARYDEALRLAQRSLIEHRRIGDTAGEALCLNNLASLHLLMNDAESAAQHLRQGLAICERDGLTGTVGYIHSNLAEVALLTGDLDAAERHCSRATEVAAASGNRAIVAWMTTHRSRLLLRRDRIGAARAALADGLELALQLGIPSLKFEGLVCFADMLSAQGGKDCALCVLSWAAAHPAASAALQGGIRERLRSMADDTAEIPGQPDMELDELLRRIVVETGVEYAPLMAWLRGARTAPGAPPA